jgi:hypothetical protein
VLAAAVELAVLSFFFAFAAEVVCAVAKDPATRKALTQKLPANFRYFVIVALSTLFSNRLLM